MVEFSHWLLPDHRIMVFNDPDFVPGEDAEMINTGDWLPALILERLFQDTQLWIRFYNWDQIESFVPSTDPNQVYWADPSGIVQLTVNSPRFTGWASPFDALGLEISNAAKLAKRLKEIVRIARYYTAAKPNVKWFATTEENEKSYDGANVIRRSFASKMGIPRRVKRGNFRLLLADGLIKGDATIISDKQMKAKHGDYDVIAPEVNLKSEIRTKGWTFATFNPYHEHNHAMFDVQSASWLREWLYPRELIKETFTHVVDGVLDNLRAGQWPNWMILPEEDAHLDELLPRDVSEKASEAFNRHYLRWQMFGMKPEHSASIMGMAGAAFNARLQAKLNFSVVNSYGGIVKKPKMWLPLPWASYGHITTHEVLTDLCGYQIPKENEDRLFYHKESQSFSLPGDQFADTFEAHGTWDLDDSAKFFIRKVKNEDRVVCVIVRSPNSDGEFSIHEVDTEGFPLYHQYGEMPEIDLGSMPVRIETVLANQVVTGLPDNPRHMDPEFTKAEADHSISVQSQNPGIGGLANAMMVYYAALGKSPEEVLCTMGDAVDAVQQTPYVEAFGAISQFTEDLWQQIGAHGRVDAYLRKTRVPWETAQGMVEYRGYFSNLFTHFAQETARYSEEYRAIAFKKRAENPIPKVKEMVFAPEVANMAATWVRFAEGQFNLARRQFSGADRRSKQQHAQANRAIIDRMVDKLNLMEEQEANELVLAMYQFCLIPGTGTPYGRSDRCLFAPTDEGKESVMDILLRALVALGVATDPEA